MLNLMEKEMERWEETIIKNDIEAVKLLIENGDVNTPVFGCFPLHIAVLGGHIDIVKLLINKGANVNMTDQIGETPLQWAASKFDLDMVELLVKEGGDLDHVNHSNDGDWDDPEGRFAQSAREILKIRLAGVIQNVKYILKWKPHLPVPEDEEMPF